MSRRPHGPERVREEMTAEILAVARAHVARDGAAGLSLRSIARDLGMAPSALYRYFDGRDALLSALILAAYESLAAEAERGGARRRRRAASDAERLLAVPRAMRRWALAHPHEWGLIFGTPVPGYEAPEDTVEPYARVAAALRAPVVEARAAGRLVHRARPRGGRCPLRCATPWRRWPTGSSRACRSRTVVRCREAWTTIVGAISLEVFGHWRNTILDPGQFFEATVRDPADALGLR